MQADLKAERSVNAFLEQKYVEAVNESERNQAMCQKAIFDLELSRNELREYKEKYGALQTQISSGTSQLREFGSAIAERDAFIEQCNQEKIDLRRYG